MLDNYEEKAICVVPIASATAEMMPVTAETAPSFRKNVGVREGENGMEGGSSPRGANTVQKPKAMSAPVAAAAMQPASDLRLANGRGTWMFVRGRRKEEGSGGVRGPYIRPKSEAVVSHQDKLEQELLLTRQRRKERSTHMRMEITAMSRGYIDSTNTQPNRYQMTPFVLCYRIIHFSWW